MPIPRITVRRLMAAIAAMAVFLAACRADLDFHGGPALAQFVASRMRRRLWPREIRDGP